MVVRRQANKPPTKVILPRRSTRKAALKAKKDNKINYIAKCTSKSAVRILDLPSENLQRIFSFFPIKELFYNIRPVCRRFKEIAMSPVLWCVIETENEVPTDTLRNWIRASKFLKRFCIKHRNDVNTIVEEVSKHGKHLECIKLQNCWGSRKNYLLHSNPLCNLVTRCPKLSSFNFSQSRFMSCKFFRLISKNNRGSVVKKCNYTGPMTPKQMKALFTALEDHEVHDTATIGNVNLNHRFKLRDIVRYVRDVSGQNQVIHEVWENINYGVIGNNGHGAAIGQNRMYPNANFIANVEDANAQNINPHPEAEIAVARLGARVAQVIRNANRANRIAGPFDMNRDRIRPRPAACDSRRSRIIQRDNIVITDRNGAIIHPNPGEAWFLDHDEERPANALLQANNTVRRANDIVNDIEDIVNVLGNVNGVFNDNGAAPNDEEVQQNDVAANGNEMVNNVVAGSNFIRERIQNDLFANGVADVQNELLNRLDENLDMDVD